MSIILSRVRISNYRSIKYLSLELGRTNLLIGQNNSGKTNFLKALDLAISGSGDISEDDIFVSQDEQLKKSKKAIIDIMLQPTDGEGKTSKIFSEFWTSVFTDTWITTSDQGNFVGIRTEIEYDKFKDTYGLNRRCIRQWNDNIDDAGVERRRTNFNEGMRTYLQSLYMDANRDIVQDLRNRRSYFGRVTSNYELTQEVICEIEYQLDSANTMIIESIPSLQNTRDRIAIIGQTIGSSGSELYIEPLARKITDLNRGMDIIMQDGKSAAFPISKHGFGTRSWISFLTLSAFIDSQRKKLMEEDDAEQFILLTLEEPEAHLHPQAQRQLYEQISGFQGQKVVSTHSPSIISQCNLEDIIYFNKFDGETKARRYEENAAKSDKQSIFREVVNTRADLLFASAVILCEGITEELVLPIFFTEYFRCAPYALGVSIISTGGQKYKQYLSLIKDFDIPWFIFSDGEKDTIQAVKSSIQDIFNIELSDSSNIVIIDNYEDYENYLISEGYGDLIIEAICEHEYDNDYFGSYIELMDGQKRKGDIVREYKQPNGREVALRDLCHEKKTEYARPVANKLIEKAPSDEKIPAKIKDLFSEVARTLGINEPQIAEDDYESLG